MSPERTPYDQDLQEKWCSMCVHPMSPHPSPPHPSPQPPSPYGNQPRRGGTKQLMENLIIVDEEIPSKFFGGWHKSWWQETTPLEKKFEFRIRGSLLQDYQKAQVDWKINQLDENEKIFR